MNRSDMLWRVIIAVVLALITGTLTGSTAEVWGVTFLSIFDLFGNLFLNALTLLVVPLVSSSIISGIGSLGKEGDFARLGARTFAFYLVTMLLAALVGLGVVNLLQPGASCCEHVQQLTGGLSAQAMTAARDALEHPPVASIFYKLVPSNLLGAAASGNMLGVIAFSLFFGFTLARMDHPATQALLHFWKGLFMVIMRMTHMLMRLMPIGVFFLVSRVIARQGLGSIANLGWFVLSVLVALLLYVLVVLPILLRIYGLSPLRHLKAMGPALLAAFSTSSSAASLPITMECAEKRAGVSHRISSFVIPLGTSVNMSGSALYECIAVLFIAQATGLHLSLVQQLLIVMMSLLTAMGMAGIPSASLVAILVILNTIGLPGEALALVIPVDRLLDMCRSTANVFSDATCAVLVARGEGEQVLGSPPPVTP